MALAASLGFTGESAMGDYLQALTFLADPYYWVMLLLAGGLLGSIWLVPWLGSTTIAAIAMGRCGVMCLDAADLPGGGAKNFEGVNKND